MTAFIFCPAQGENKDVKQLVYNEAMYINHTLRVLRLCILQFPEHSWLYLYTQFPFYFFN